MGTMTDDTNTDRPNQGKRRGKAEKTEKNDESVPQTLDGDLDLNGNDLINFDNFWSSSEYASFATSGSGQGRAQLYDTVAGTYFLRAFEGATDDPGPVEFQAPITGARADAPGTTRPGPLRVLDGAVVDNLSVAGTNRIDVVAEPSIDHTADLGAEIGAYLDERETIDHTLVIPEGTYSWNSALRVSTFDSLAIVGEPEAVLSIESSAPDVALELGSGNGGGSRLFLRNLTVELAGVDAGLAKVNVEESAVLENLTLRGRRHRRGVNGGDRYAVLLNVLEESGAGAVRNVTLPDGGTEVSGGSDGHAIGFGASVTHRGTTLFEGCYAEGFVAHGFHVANSPGSSILQGCTAKNNGGGNVVLGDGDVCRDSRIVLDDGPERRYPGCGLWFGDGAPVAENVIVDAPAAANDVIRVNSDADGGRIRDVDVALGADTRAYAVRLSQGGTDAPDPLVLQNVTITDDVRYDDDERGYSISLDRENVTLRDCNLRISEADRPRGGAFVARPGVRFDGCTFEVANDGFVLNFDADDADLFGCRLEGTGSRPADLVFRTDCDPQTFETIGNRFENVELNDWNDSGIALADLR